MPLPLRHSEPGPILGYLTQLRAANPKLAEQTIAAVRALLRTQDGAILLDLLDKSTVQALVPILADPRALEARNAQGFIVSDLRRIVTNETEQLVQQQTDKAGTRLAVGKPRA
jgi:hypothetical protein